jgi:glycosyltransferase involved in cell wall biosynthesis
MKKIWLISYHLEGVTAGPSVRFQRYAPYFGEQGYRLVFVTLKTNPGLPDTEQKEHFDIIRVSSNFKYFHNTLFLAKSLIKAIFAKDKPSTILTFSITTFHLWLIPLIKLRGLKLIFVNTMSLHTTYLGGKSIFASIYNKLHFFLYGILFRNLNYIINSSNALTAGFKQHGVPSNKLKTIYNGVNNQRFKPVSETEKLDYRKKLNLPETGKIILFVGLKVERKGILDLMESWKLFYKNMPDHYLLMVGDEKSSASDPDYNKHWEGIKKEIENPELRIINRPNHPAIEEYFYSSDIFIFLSKKEGMPNVVLEAMSAGLPMIITEFEGFSDDYGEDGKEYLLVNRDANQIAESLSKLCNDQNLYQTIKSNSIKRISDHFLLEKSISQYTQLFELSK